MAGPDAATDAPPAQAAGAPARLRPAGLRAQGRTFGLAWLIAFTGAVTPGPLLALVIGQVLAQGFAAVLLILLGHALLECVFIGGFAVGLTQHLRRRRARGVLALVGGLALAWMGWDIVRHAGQMTLAGAEVEAMAWPMLILAGAGVSLSNPYFTGWWATVGTGQMATFALRRPRDYVVFWIGHEMGDIVWYAFVGAVLALGRGLLTDAVYRALLLACGWIICLLAAVFLVLGARCLRPWRGQTDLLEVGSP
ncbi:MAG: LysE family transporter [Lentisphaeria bacterium]|nr:LysE family transporter [Lentisphaeria bacterium]